MNISLEDGKTIANLINSCINWGSIIDKKISKGDYENVPQFMEWHNEAGRELNEILGVPAIILYKDFIINEEY